MDINPPKNMLGRYHIPTEQVEPQNLQKANWLYERVKNQPSPNELIFPAVITASATFILPLIFGIIPLIICGVISSILTCIAYQRGETLKRKNKDYTTWIMWIITHAEKEN